MEKLRNISSKKQWLAISLGIVLGIFALNSIVSSQELIKDVVEQPNDEGSETISELNFEAVHATAKTSIERNSYLIQILPEIEEPESEDVNEVSFLPSPAKVFKILFEHIISPNSP